LRSVLDNCVCSDLGNSLLHMCVSVIGFSRVQQQASSGFFQLLICTPAMPTYRTLVRGRTAVVCMSLPVRSVQSAEPCPVALLRLWEFILGLVKIV